MPPPITIHVHTTTPAGRGTSHSLQSGRPLLVPDPRAPRAAIIPPALGRLGVLRLRLFTACSTACLRGRRISSRPRREEAISGVEKSLCRKQDALVHGAFVAVGQDARQAEERRGGGEAGQRLGHGRGHDQVFSSGPPRSRNSTVPSPRGRDDKPREDGASSAARSSSARVSAATGPPCCARARPVATRTGHSSPWFKRAMLYQRASGENHGHLPGAPGRGGNETGEHRRLSGARRSRDEWCWRRGAERRPTEGLRRLACPVPWHHAAKYLLVTVCGRAAGQGR